ncbi:uncharacterized protein LOC123540175 [Mercenaria mercenaria]|uniref:uncharacterized protein LOC123540175 n=1 Tax=Mercenaria mercenaria TaxID=6596 RepID=UPI001E1DE6BC|nr:uncharacterized protein LOC123540175 [Mercenaria mercenaria]
MGNLMWAGVGFVICIFSSLLIIIAFATPYWIVPEDGAIVSTQLEKLGLWEICFAGYSDHRDSFGRTYNGCWWIFAREYDAIRKYLITGWFATTQALMTVSVILSLCSVLFGLLMLLNCMPSIAQKYSAIFVCLSNYLIFVLIAVGLIYFGTHADTDRSWLRFPNLRTLSWSFYLAAIGGILALLSALAYTLYWMKVRVAGRHSTAYRAHELRTYRTDRYYR